MGRRSRSRSRSPKRDRRRSPGRDRDRERERRDRHRSRSPHRRRRSPSPRRRSPGRRRSRSRERDRVRDYDRRDREVVHDYNHGQSSRDVGVSNVQQQHLNNRGLSNRPSIDASAIEGKTEEEIEMMKVMGFGGFDTTKGKHIEGNDVYVANIQRKRRYRQYMNRRGGFNRPLDFIA